MAWGVAVLRGAGGGATAYLIELLLHLLELSRLEVGELDLLLGHPDSLEGVYRQGRRAISESPVERPVRAGRRRNETMWRRDQSCVSSSRNPCSLLGRGSLSSCTGERCSYSTCRVLMTLMLSSLTSPAGFLMMQIGLSGRLPMAESRCMGCPIHSTSH